MNNREQINDRSIERVNLHFVTEAVLNFAFLHDFGFEVIATSPTIVEYKRGDIIANVYHGRQSYEIGFEIVHDGACYSLSELIRVADTEAASSYTDFVATTRAAVSEGLKQAHILVTRYAMPSLQGDAAAFATLKRQRKVWAEQLERETKLASVRPRAEEAFRQGRYAEAALLYDHVRSDLTPVEIKKAEISKDRAAKAR